MGKLKDLLKSANEFAPRHIGVHPAAAKEMLNAVGSDSLESLLDEIIPENIRQAAPLDIGEAIDEPRFLKELAAIAQKNKIYKSYIGLGYYGTIVPGVIARNVLENPGWYTAYTPYQAEISQGRLEALLNFQTLVTDLTGMEIANSSLLDEGTAAAEAMGLSFRSRSREKSKNGANIFLVSDKCFPQTIDILQTRAEPLGIKIIVDAVDNFELTDNVFGMLLQYPDADGGIRDYTELIARGHESGILATVAADLLSLTLLKSPGEMDADIVVGCAQRFGVPRGFGGPHAAFFATREQYKRQVPGRIIGVSQDRHGNKAHRMALQTREQHIRREKATSNICTAQVLLANMSSMYAVYHGPEGLKAIAERVHGLSALLAQELEKLGCQQLNNLFFDTIHIQLPDGKGNGVVQKAALAAGVNFRYSGTASVHISLDETTRLEDVEQIISIFGKAFGISPEALSIDDAPDRLTEISNNGLARTSDYLTHPVFHEHRTETKMLRYIHSLEKKDLSLTSSMIPLGSCTMKLNATSQLIPVSWPEFSSLHPFVPQDQAEGYVKMIKELEALLCEITGFAAMSLQPNSGAQGEYAGMQVISAYHQDRGEPHRNVTLIPSSAHGTNPASAIMAGMKVVMVKCDDQGNIDVADLKEKAEAHSENLSALMVTYPSTHGVFEESIREICDIVHQHGGQVYMDGANMNAQVGLTSPGLIGADVCHLNLHKTFSIPHGGGGPGMGPIGVAKHLAPFLPGHIFATENNDKAIGAVSATNWGSAGILMISYAYIKLLGSQGVTDATKYAILNANYIKARLEHHFPVLYTGKNGRVAHELIFDCRPFKQSAGVEVEDIAKRLMDFGFHAPTVSFPVAGTIMVEPTESESKDELDRFCEAMIMIYEEIKEIETGVADRQDNVLKNAPHTAAEVLSDDWAHAYTREKAAFPLSWVRQNKFWPAVGRIDNAYGDRNLMCTCPPLEEYAEVEG